MPSNERGHWIFEKILENFYFRKVFENFKRILWTIGASVKIFFSRKYKGFFGFRQNKENVKNNDPLRF